MGKKRSSFRRPFVLTCSVVAVAACGSEVLVESSGVSSGASSGTSGSVNCPAEAPLGYVPCASPPGEQCVYDIPCQSGVRQIAFECLDQVGEGPWTVVADQACVQPYDSCPNTELYCGTQWGLPLGSNPPAPCPSALPEEGDECMFETMGADRRYCGYRCGETPGSGWVVAECVGVPGEFEGEWIHDEGDCD